MWGGVYVKLSSRFGTQNVEVDTNTWTWSAEVWQDVAYKAELSIPRDLNGALKVASKPVLYTNVKVSSAKIEQAGISWALRMTGTVNTDSGADSVSKKKKTTKKTKK